MMPPTVPSEPSDEEITETVTLPYAGFPQSAQRKPRYGLLLTALIIDGVQWMLIPPVYSNSTLSDEEALKLFIAYILLGPGLAFVYFARPSSRSWTFLPYLLHIGWTFLLTLRMLNLGFCRY